MKVLDLTLATPADNLACDEALLNWSETGDGGEILRLWEPREHFVVVGYANKVEQEVNVPACRVRGVPIFRRCSGGGTVLQGPGCLNYTLILHIAEHPRLSSISGTNQFIMEQNRAAIEAIVRSRNPDVRISVCGHTDLAVAAPHSPGGPKGNPSKSPVALWKFSGNSQRRQKRVLLFHGTFLLHLDLVLLTEILRMPSHQPDYRRNRGHMDFLANLNLPSAPLKNALRATWKATEELPHFPTRETSRLGAEKYSTREWNFKL
jgi:lipoate-protein ligase A